MARRKAITLKDLRNAWLSPTGRLVVDDVKECLDLLAWHQDIACAIIRDEQGLDSHKTAFFWVAGLKFNYSPTEYLEDKRWIRLHGFGGRKPGWIARERITKAQERVIVDWCVANGRPYSDAFIK